MTVIYFTDGALIDDVTVRRSLLRIPEVISFLRKAEKEFLNCDLFMAMNEADAFRALNYHQRLHLKNKIQGALFQRWMNSGGEPDLILRRSDYKDFSELAVLFSKLSTIDQLNVVTIGPGLDELEVFLRLKMKLTTNPVRDFISQDPKLNWFWVDVKNNLEFHS